MKYTSIFEKITCLSKIISSSIIYPIFLIVLVILIGLLFTKKIKNKKVIVLMIISYLILFIITISNNYEALSKVFDSISTNLFTNIYFPSTYTYLLILLIVDITTIISLLNIKTEKIYRVTNGICFFVLKFILVLIMELIAKNNIDIFSKKSLFSNSNLVVLLESSIGIFIIWLITLIIIYISTKITERIIIRNTNKELETTSISLLNNLELDISNNKLEEEYNEDVYIPNEVVTNNIIQDNYNLNTTKNIETTPNTNEIQVNNIEEKTNINSDLLFEKLLNNGLPIIKEENININIIEPNEIKNMVKEETKNVVKEENVKDSYTLNDYRIFNKILNDIKEFNNSNIVEINPYLELKLKAKYTAEKYYLFKSMLNNDI